MIVGVATWYAALLVWQFAFVVYYAASDTWILLYGRELKDGYRKWWWIVCICGTFCERFWAQVKAWAGGYSMRIIK